MNDLQSRTSCLSESKSHSQLLSSSLHSSAPLHYDTLTSYQQSQIIITNYRDRLNSSKYRIGRDRLRSISISSHQQNQNQYIPCSPSSSSYNKKEERIDFALNDENSIANNNNNNNLISDSEFLIVKYNLLNKLKAMSKQTIIRNLLTNDMHNIHIQDIDIDIDVDKQTQIAHTLKDMIFSNITEWECVTKIQRRLSDLIKQYGKYMIINALNIEILIYNNYKHQNHPFYGTLTAFLYNKVSKCKSLLLIYDWHEIAKCIILYGGNIPNLLSHKSNINNSKKPLLRMNLLNNSRNNNNININIEHIKFEWNMPIIQIKTKNLFLYCLNNNISPFVIDNYSVDGKININLKNVNRCNIQSDLLLIYILKYQMECWNEMVFESMNNYKDMSIATHIIINYCYDIEQLSKSFDFIYNKLWQPLTIKMYDNNNKNSNLLRYINNKNNKNNRSITLCIIYSILRKKETGISSIRKLLQLTSMYHYDKESNIGLLINNVLKYHEILKSRLFSQLIECNDDILVSLLLKYDILIDSQCSGLSFTSFAKLCINISDNKCNKLCIDFLRHNSSINLYGITNFCHNTNNDEVDVIKLFNNKNGLQLNDDIMDQLLFRGLRPFATLTNNGNIPTILYQQLEIFNHNTNININHYNTLSCFIIYFKFKKIKSWMRDLLKQGIKIFNNDLCNIINSYLFIDNIEIDSFFQWLFRNKIKKINKMNKNCHFSIQYILEYEILNRFSYKNKFNIYSHKKQIVNNGIEAYWDWIYLILINNKRFIDYLMNNKYHRLWLLNILKTIIKTLYKLNQNNNKLNQIKRITGFAIHHFDSKEIRYLNLFKLSMKKIKKPKKHFIIQRAHSHTYSNRNYFKMRKLNSL